jgi:hypothetical protein
VPAENEVSAVEEEVLVAAAPASVAVYERQAPTGSRCASVFFGSVEAAEVAIPAMADGTLEPSPRGRACGLTFTVEVPGAPRYVGFILDVESGSFFEPESPTAALDGATAFSGRRSWSIDFLHTMPEPFAYRLLVVSATDPVDQETKWLRAQENPITDADSLAERGIEISVIRHTVGR